MYVSELSGALKNVISVRDRERETEGSLKHRLAVEHWHNHLETWATANWVIATHTLSPLSHTFILVFIQNIVFWKIKLNLSVFWICQLQITVPANTLWHYNMRFLLVCKQVQHHECLRGEIDSNQQLLLSLGLWVGPFETAINTFSFRCFFGGTLFQTSLFEACWTLQVSEASFCKTRHLLVLVLRITSPPELEKSPVLT